MSTASWIVFASVMVAIAAYLGFVAGREAAESRCAATIASLRASLLRYRLTDHSDDRRPE